MQRLTLAMMAAAAMAAALATNARADMSVCQSSEGNWKATGTIESAMSMMGAYSIDFAEEVKAENMVETKSPLSPLKPGDCMVKAAGGLGDLPEGCKNGAGVTVIGRLSYDAGIAIVNVAKSSNISCQ